MKLDIRTTWGTVIPVKARSCVLVVLAAPLSVTTAGSRMIMRDCPQVLLVQHQLQRQRRYQVAAEHLPIILVTVHTAPQRMAVTNAARMRRGTPAGTRAGFGTLQVVARAATRLAFALSNNIPAIGENPGMSTRADAQDLAFPLHRSSLMSRAMDLVLQT